MNSIWKCQYISRVLRVFFMGQLSHPSRWFTATSEDLFRGTTSTIDYRSAQHLALSAVDKPIAGNSRTEYRKCPRTVTCCQRLKWHGHALTEPMLFVRGWFTNTLLSIYKSFQKSKYYISSMQSKKCNFVKRNDAKNLLIGIVFVVADFMFYGSKFVTDRGTRQKR